MRNRNNKAFSLQELLLVIAIIAVMVVVLVTSGLSLRKQADLRAVDNTLAVLNTALDTYYDARGSYPFIAEPYYTMGTEADFTDDIGFMRNDASAVLGGGGWTNQEPDLIKANYQASIEALYRLLLDAPETAEMLDSISEQYITAKNSNGDVIMLGQRPLIRVIDPWGNPYRYVYADGYGVASIESAGPDGKFALTPADDEGYNSDNISY
jgi:type II secretory pathway pseudopilin PulG